MRPVSEVAAIVNSPGRAGVMSREMRDASAVGMGRAQGPLVSSPREGICALARIRVMETLLRQLYLVSGAPCLCISS
jgi:hypothetical protein